MSNLTYQITHYFFGYSWLYLKKITEEFVIKRVNLLALAAATTVAACNISASEHPNHVIAPKPIEEIKEHDENERKRDKDTAEAARERAKERQETAKEHAEDEREHAKDRAEAARERERAPKPPKIVLRMSANAPKRRSLPRER